MAVITNAPNPGGPFVEKDGRIVNAWYKWLLSLIGTATTGGTVTHTGTLTSGKTIVGNGGADIKVSTLTATVVKSSTGVLSAATAGTDYTALAFKTIAVSGQSDIVADSAADLLTVAAGSGVTLTTNASTDTLTIAAAGTGGTVTNTGTLTSGKLIQGNGGVDVTANATTATVTKLTAGTPSAASAGTDYVAPGSITTDGITMSTARLLGRTTASSGAVEEITAGTGLSLSAGTLTATGTGGTVTTTGSPASGNLTKFSGATSITNADLTGDVTTSGGVATTLATVNSNVGTFGDGTHVAQVTANAKGLITAVSSVAITNQGTVTHTAGNLTSGQLVYGNGTADLETTAATDGQIPIGKTSDGTAALATLTAGTNITISNAANAITINATPGSGGTGNSTYTTAVGSEPGSPNSGDLDFYTNGVDIVRYSGSAWVPWGPIFPLTAPVSSSFSWVNQGSATIDTTSGGVYLFGPKTAGTSMRVRELSISTNTSLSAGFLFAPFSDSTSTAAGITLRESSSSKIAFFKLNANGVLECAYGPSATNLTTDAFTSHSTLSMSAIWLRITLSGSNYVFFVSPNGQQWVQIAVVAKTTMFTTAADKWGFAVDAQTANFDVSMSLISWATA